MGVQPAVIDCVDSLCDIIGELTEDVQLLMSKVQQEVSASVETSPLPEAEVPVTKDNGSVEASEGDSASKKTEPVEDTQMSKDTKPKVDVISSAAEAAAAIKKEKEAKEKALKDIFSDNKTGRYSAPIDA